MAFCNRLGSLIRKTNGQASMPSMLNAFRSMSSSKLFVGGLAWETDDQSLSDAFASFGDVTEARVITDRETGKSRGFGFVSYTDTESASSAISSMDGKDLNGRSIRVSYATERSDRPRTNYGGGNGYGGFGDGGATNGF